MRASLLLCGVPLPEQADLDLEVAWDILTLGVEAGRIISPAQWGVESFQKEKPDAIDYLL